MRKGRKVRQMQKRRIARTIRWKVLGKCLKTTKRSLCQRCAWSIVYDDVTYVHDDVTYVYDDVTYAYEQLCQRCAWSIVFPTALIAS